MFFPEPLLVFTFSHFMLILCEIPRFWDPSWTHLGTKWRPKSTKWRQEAPKKYPPRSKKCAPEPNLAPETPPEAPLVTCFIIFEGFWNRPGLILNDFEENTNPKSEGKTFKHQIVNPKTGEKMIQSKRICCYMCGSPGINKNVNLKYLRKGIYNQGLLG